MNGIKKARLSNPSAKLDSLAGVRGMMLGNVR